MTSGVILSAFIVFIGRWAARQAAPRAGRRGPGRFTSRRPLAGPVQVLPCQSWFFGFTDTGSMECIQLARCSAISSAEVLSKVIRRVVRFEKGALCRSCHICPCRCTVRQARAHGREPPPAAGEHASTAVVIQPYRNPPSVVCVRVPGSRVDHRLARARSAS